MDEEELLSSLEESLDYNNGGFVSTFTLPVVADDGNVGSGPFSIKCIIILSCVSVCPCSLD